MLLTLLCLIFLSSNLTFAKETISFDKKINENSYFKLNSKKVYKHIKNNNFIEIKLINNDIHEKEFYLGLKDNKTSNYWGQFTFKTYLSRGENTLKINLNRNVGERGSYKYNRRLNKNKLKDIFIVFNPDKRTKARSITLKEISFYNAPKVSLPKTAKYFLFNETDQQLYPFATLINKNTKYKKNKESGFESIKLWQERNSKIAPQALARSLGVLQARFSLDLPKGKYKYELIWDELGYWEAPFWKIRKLFVNDEPIVIESRPDWKDFLSDLFRYKNKAVHPESFLIREIFQPQVGLINHKGGKLSFSVEGDQTGASLNTLLIYPEEKESEVKDFKAMLDVSFMFEFDAKYRWVKESLNKSPKEVIFSDRFDSTGSCVQRDNNRYVFALDSQVLRLCFRGYENKEIKIISEGNSFLTQQLTYKYTSLDLNHESYAFIPYMFEPVGDQFIARSNNQVVELHFRNKLKKSNDIYLVVDGKKQKLNFKVNYFNNPKKLPINIGVFGPSAIPFTYYNGVGKEEWLKSFNNRLLSFLDEMNINFVLDADSFGFNYNKNNTNFSLNLKNKKNYFYVSEQFKSLIAGDERNVAQDEKSYFENLNVELKKKKSIYLYSDEASGYRDAIQTDIKAFKTISQKLPALYLGGFGNLYDDKKAKELYELWDIGYFTDLPDQSFVKVLNQRHSEWGIYNLCAEIQAPMRFCYGIVLFKLYKAGVKNIIEWHLNSSQNLPYFDLDGREADIAFIETDENGEIFETLRFREMQEGLLVFQKLLALESYLSSRKVKGLKDSKLQKWLQSLIKPSIFPVKSYISRFDNNELSNFYIVLDEYCRTFLR